MKRLLLAFGAAVSLATAGHAATITFDDLGCCYGPGEGYGLLPNMSFDGETLTYTSGDYLISFVGGPFSHIGDGTYVDQTLNWHDHPDNADDTTIYLARIDGGAFDLTSFDYSVDDHLWVSAAGHSTLALGGSGTGQSGLLNVRSVSFFADGYANQLDNIVVNAAAGVPEPASWALMLVGFGAVGGAMRGRRRSVVAFA